MSTKTHDELIHTFLAYFKQKAKYEKNHSELNGRKTRKLLMKIRQLAKSRRAEILEKQLARRAAKESSDEL